MSGYYCCIALIPVSANDDWETINKDITAQNTEFTTRPENPLGNYIPFNHSIRNQESKFPHGKILDFYSSKFIAFPTKLQ